MQKAVFFFDLYALCCLHIIRLQKIEQESKRYIIFMRCQVDLSHFSCKNFRWMLEFHERLALQISARLMAAQTTACRLPRHQVQNNRTPLSPTTRAKSSRLCWPRFAQPPPWDSHRRLWICRETQCWHIAFPRRGAGCFHSSGQAIQARRAFHLDRQVLAYV